MSVVDDAPPARRGAASRAWTAPGWAFNLPYLLGFLAVYVAPVGYAIWQSTHQEKRSGLGFGAPKVVFTGFQNFSQVLGDGAFWTSLLRVVAVAAVEIPVVLGLALVLALLLDVVKSRLARYFRVAFLVPYMVPIVVATLVWLYLYSPVASPLVAAFHGLNFFTPVTTYLSIGNVLVWAQIGFNMILFAAALQAIPGDLFEAARLDGAGEPRIAWSIKIPAVRPVLVLTGMFSIIGMLQLFTEPQILRQLAPQAISMDFTPMQSIYAAGFSANNYDYAAAMSVVLAVVTGILAFVFYRITNRRTVL